MAILESIRVSDAEHELIAQAAASHDDTSIEQYIYDLVIAAARKRQDDDSIKAVQERAGSDTDLQDAQIAHVSAQKDEQTYSQLKGQDGTKNDDKNDSGKVGVPTDESKVPEKKPKETSDTAESVQVDKVGAPTLKPPVVKRPVKAPQEK